MKHIFSQKLAGYLMYRGFVLLKMSEDKSVIDLVSQLKEMSDVEYAEPNYKVFITADVPFGIATESPNQKMPLKNQFSDFYDIKKYFFNFII